MFRRYHYHYDPRVAGFVLNTYVEPMVFVAVMWILFAVVSTVEHRREEHPDVKPTPAAEK